MHNFLPIVLHHTKTICKGNHEIQVFELLEQIGQKMQGFLYLRDGRVPPPTNQKFANSPPHQETFAASRLFPPKKMFIPPQ